MKTRIRAVIALGLASMIGLSASFAGHARGKSLVEPKAKQFVKVSTPRKTARIGIGKPNSFSFQGGWVTSNLLTCSLPVGCEACVETSDFLTDVVWFDDEELAVVGSFYSLNARDTTVSVLVKSESGQQVFNDSFTDALTDPDATYIALFEIGVLPAGAYKVAFKAKQGSKTVGHQYWINVFSDVPGSSEP